MFIISDKLWNEIKNVIPEKKDHLKRMAVPTEACKA